MIFLNHLVFLIIETMNDNTQDVETMLTIKRQMETQSHMICNRKTLNDIQLSRTKINHDYRYCERLDGCAWCYLPESEHTRPFIT